MAQISTERVNAFLEGRDPMQRIITIETEYKADDVLIVYIDDEGKKRFKREPFMPFLWAKHSAAIRLFNGDRNVIKAKLRECGISVKALKTNNGKESCERLENGYKFLFYATRRMSYTQFLSFFEAGGVPVYDKKSKNSGEGQSKEYLAIAPAEQFMIRTGKRLFKGYENYNDLCRCTFDLETQGLNPKVHRIEQIGIHTNRDYDKILSVNKDGSNELECIDEFLQILSELEPDIVVGHNSENFDWDFIIVRLEELGTSLEELSLKYFKRPIYKKKTEAVLKLGGEVEYYRPTVMYGHVVLDSLHAARRAQALDSNMKSSNLKYLTKYLGLVKPNRVYVPGDKISTTWNDTSKSYVFNDIDGTWRKAKDDEEELDRPYQKVTGRYIVERYLLDDLWETDKVEEKLNESNFLVAKLLPTTFTKACTMGTAGIWKLIMLAWSFENDLAIPSFSESKRFTGGLSRLLKTGFVDDIVKLDYNSLYPSIILSWWISTPIDIMGVMNALLEYVLTQREKYKGLKADAGKMADKLKAKLESEEDPVERDKIKEEIRKWKIEKTANDKKQLPLKILANSFFGSYGAPNIFPFGDVIAAEMTTCTGRMMLRLMISHFTKIGYTPIVGDSFTGDTPLFIKYDKSGLIDIKPISELMSNHFSTDALGREYDTTEKNYSVLCRSGWRKPDYIYRHKTSKYIYRVTDGVSSVDVTEDHSLFDENHKKVSPKQITENTKLEYFTDYSVFENESVLTSCDGKKFARMIRNGQLDRVPVKVLNGDNETVKTFLMSMDGFEMTNASKTLIAGLMYLKNKKGHERRI